MPLQNLCVRIQYSISICIADYLAQNIHSYSFHLWLIVIFGDENKILILMYFYMCYLTHIHDNYVLVWSFQYFFLNYGIGFLCGVPLLRNYQINTFQDVYGADRRAIKFHRKDSEITVNDLWDIWKKSDIHNWTVDQTIE